MLAGSSDFVPVVKMLEFIVFMTGTISPQFQCLKRLVLTFSIDHAIQNGFGASNPASQRERPISRSVLSLRFINSCRERA